MKSKIIAKRYADAFLAYSQEFIGRDKAIADLKNLKMLIFKNPEFVKFISNPQISFQEKSEVIDKIFSQNFSSELRDFLKLLLDKNRIGLVIDICDYVRLVYAHQEAVEAVLKSAYPLDLENISKLKDKMEKKIKRKLNLYLEIDPDLLGGVQIRVGNKLFDGSVKRRLVELRERLMTVQVA